MTIAKFHSEWLNLIEVNGPFLTLPVLAERLRSGLEPTDSELVAELHTAQREVEDDPSLHPVWTRWVITRLLGFPDEVLREGAGISPSFTHRVVEHGETLRPDFVVADQADGGEDKARLLINIWPPGTELTQRPNSERWAASPIDRIAELCRATTVRLGLVTNGDTWTLVDAPADGTTGTATWDAALWSEERATLDAFTTLLGIRRFFTVAHDETLEALLIQSASAEAEVTDQLGKQVRAAVELLVDAMSRADRERNGSVFRELLDAELDQGLEPYIYEAAVTVLMRLVFLLSAEERGLFLLGDPNYDATYAVSTLLAQLDEDANRYGEEVLERRTDAWHRLLATFRMVYAGAAHANFRLPPYGGNLFDPDRFRFLEGRRPNQPISEQVTSLRIDNRTVKHILDALQVLRFRGRGGWQEARRLSFRSLDVEQIGHVYEGLLDHGVVQVTADAVALTGKNDPEVALVLIETEAAKGHAPLVSWLAELAGDTPNSVEKALSAVPTPDHLDRLASACDNDAHLAARIAPYLGLLRTDLRGLPQVYLAGSYYVTKSSDRRSSGAYYTPRALAEEMVTHTLQPLVYEPGPAEGATADHWKLKPSLSLLDLRICDPAMGSGAFLVSACRYLSARVLEAWDLEGLSPGQVIALPGGGSTAMPNDDSDREILARRLVADRCLFGVDRNSMAVEMAKLSIWLITLAKDRPFTFVDHALRCGDSLLGIVNLDQLNSFHLDPVTGRQLHEGTLFDPATMIMPIITTALEKRRELESFTVISVSDAETKQALLADSAETLDQLKVVADLIVGAGIATASQPSESYNSKLLSVVDDVVAALAPRRAEHDKAARLFDLRLRTQYWLDEGRPPISPERRCLHWPLEFPEIFLDRDSPGFDAIVGNPPFLGGSRISPSFGKSYRDYLAKWFASEPTDRADLVCFFFLRASQLGGVFGLISTTSIADSASRSVGLEPLQADGRFAIYMARTRASWPTKRGRWVSLIWHARQWTGRVVLDGTEVSVIDSGLHAGSRLSLNMLPYVIIRNQALCYMGDKPGNSEFVLTDEQARRLMARGGEEIIKRYVGGSDINDSPRHMSDRWVIDFKDETESEARTRCPPAFEYLEHNLKSKRQLASRAPYRKYWWRFAEPSRELGRAISEYERVIVMTEVSRTLWPALVPTGPVFSNKVVVFLPAREDLFGYLLSSAHLHWTLRWAQRQGVAPSYNPKNVFHTYPLPEVVNEEVSRLALVLSDARQTLMLASSCGLTATCKRFNDPADDDPSVAHLRVLQSLLDRAVFSAYGWGDLECELDFWDTTVGLRFTVGPDVAQELLDRLLEMNHRIHEAEVEGGFRPLKTYRGRSSSKRPPENQMSMGEDYPALPRESL